MNNAWEEKFRFWAQPPSETETERCENAEKMVRNAIQGSAKLKSRNIKVFTQGSYRNRTNIRGESDVDVGVLCYDTFFHDDLPEGTTRASLGIQDASYHYEQFKNDVGEALVSYFGSGAVKRGNKAFDIKATSHHVDADVAPFFEHRRYNKNGSFLSGVELRPDTGPKVVNWPEQHYANGNTKNTRTGRSYRALVRVIKNLRCEMQEKRLAAAGPVIGFLNECLIWNTPDGTFAHSTYYDDLKAALIFLYQQTEKDEQCQGWGEVSELKYLFGAHQKWTRQQAHDFVLAAWNHVGFS